ncbi:ABC transporter ATP-binding protein [Microbacterium sp.]|uniref:ABC transporter ATP-binding protein n=1 Tax=Microbacterium sp. TaxID=51671 RepID=UPI0037C6C007
MNTNASALATLHGVTRRYGDTIAVDDVTLEIEPGEIVGMLGPNGAGKTTILSLIQGLRRPSSGTVRLFGGDPRDARSRMRLGGTPQETALPETLRVGEVMDFVGRHFDRRTEPAELAEQFGLTEMLRRQTGSLSGGQKRRLSVALAFVGSPELVLLDEPTTGLDVDGRRALWEAIRAQHDRGVTVVVTSHYLEEIEALAERVIVIGEGRVLADDRLGAVLAHVGRSRVAMKTTDAAAVARLDPAAHHETDGDTELFFTADSDRFVRGLVAGGIPFHDLTVRGASLEEAFLALTGETADTASERSVLA